MTHNFPVNTYVFVDRNLTRDELKEVIILAIKADINVPETLDELLSEQAREFRISVDVDFDLYSHNLDEFNEEEIVILSYKDFLKFFKGKGDKSLLKLQRPPKPPKPISIALNGLYTAEIDKNCVKVGCQTFTHSVIEEVYQAIQKIKSEA